MNSYNFTVSVGSGLNRSFWIPPPIREQFEKKLYSKIESKLIKEEYPIGDYLLSFSGDGEFWKIDPRKQNILNRNHGFLADAGLYRKSGYNGGGYDLITGSISLFWKVYEGQDELMVKEIGYDLTDKITSESTRFIIQEIDLIPNLNKNSSLSNKSKICPLLKYKYKINCDWPDVIFNIYFNMKISYNVVDMTNDVFNTFVSNWNDSLSKDEDSEFIDYIGNAKIETKKNAITIHVDFGHCDPEKVLISLLEYLNKSELDIREIIIK